jgi:hypothetical protein
MIQQIIDFFKSIQKQTWQDVVLSSIFIPLVFFLFTRIKSWYILSRPKNLLLKGCNKAEAEVLIFLSQLSGASPLNINQKNLNQKYISFYPCPTPQDRLNLESKHYQNIDHVWTEADGRCAADIFNILGSVDKITNVRIADTVKDWDKRECGIFSIGFNPKTFDLMNDECSFINFTGKNEEYLTMEYLSITGHDLKLDATNPNDASIIQKTFIKKTATPVFILAGLGTTGVEAAGYFLGKKYMELGKLYGSKGFCILLQNNSTKGRTYSEIKAVFPKPSFLRALIYPITYYTWFKKRVFPV